MKERPIPFSAPMVRAILDGTKTQTRRALHPDLFISSSGAIVRMKAAAVAGVTGITEAHCPYGQPGDRLWVREAWHVAAVHDHVPGSELGFAPLPQVQYEAIGDGRDETSVEWGRYRPARFMPRWASRITLEVTGVRVERLHAISEADAQAEGAPSADLASGRECIFPHQGTHRWGFQLIWQQINGFDSWAANLWVWVVEFRRI